MSTTAIILRDPNLQKVAFTPEAEAMKEAALNAAAPITSCDNADENEKAVAAVRALKSLCSNVEKARAECKRPVLEYGRIIDDHAKAFVEEVNSELTRVNALVNAWAYRQLEIQRERENAKKAELLRLERERAEATAKALAEAPTQAEAEKAVEAVQEKFALRAQVEAPPPEPIKMAKGQNAPKEENDFEVTDVWALARAHPMCCKIEVLRGQVKSLLDAGVKVAGVRAFKVVKAGLRVGREGRAIDV